MLAASAQPKAVVGGPANAQQAHQQDAGSVVLILGTLAITTFHLSKTKVSAAYNVT